MSLLEQSLIDVQAELARCTVNPEEWRQMLARWAVGSLHRELDDLAKRTGDRTPEAVLDVLLALQRLLADLGLDGTRSPLAAQVWRGEP